MPVIKDKGHSKYPILLGSYSLTFLYSCHICRVVAKAQWSLMAFASCFTFSFIVPTPNRTQLCMSMFLQRKVGWFFLFWRKMNERTALDTGRILIFMVPRYFLFLKGGAPTGPLLNQRSGGDFGHDYQEEGWFHLSDFLIFHKIIFFCNSIIFATTTPCFSIRWRNAARNASSPLARC